MTRSVCGVWACDSSLATLVSSDCRLIPTRSGYRGVAAARAVVADGLPGNSDDHGAARNFFDDNGIGADPAVVADLDRAENFRAGADDHPVADGRMTLAGVCAGSAERDAVINRDVVADLGGFADHHAGGVVDEQAGAQGRTGMDVDPGQDPGDLTERAGGHLRAASPQPMADSVTPNGMHAWVGEHDLQRAGDGGIAVFRRLDVAPERVEHG